MATSALDLPGRPGPTRAAAAALPVNPLVGGTRAAVGQGAMLGWGDEAEAWLRAKAGEGTYEDNLRRIRAENAVFARQHPIAQPLLEVGGGALPGVAAAMVPGGQPLAAQQGLGALARLAALGAASGAVAGAGSAEEGGRTAGAVGGGTLGATLGVGVPLAMRGTGAGARWLRERIAPSEAYLTSRAAGKLNEALTEAGTSPGLIQRILATDRAMQVPSLLANVSPTTADLAETVAQRAGKSSRTVAEKLAQQKAGARERTYQQVVKGLRPGDYYADEQKLIENLRAKAEPAYEGVFAKGQQIDDPVVNTILQHPTFQDAYRRGQKIAESKALAAKLRGEPDYEKYLLPEIYKPTGKVDSLTNTPVMELTQVPNLRTLDYVKRGLDDLIDAGFRGQSSVGKGQASALKELRNQFRGRLDQLVPEYKDVRRMYAGDMEVMEAMRMGMKDFGKLDHEQVINAVAGMSAAEKEAFRTGVARDLYSRVMDPATNFNAAQRIIGSPEMQAKLQPLFDSPGQFKLFKTALEREAQLFNQANQILGGSQTGKRMQMRERFESGPGVGEAVGQAITGGFWNSLTGLAARAVSKGSLSDDVAERLAGMLMARDPGEVAAVVRLLEKQAAEAAPQALRAGARQAGAVTGTAAAAFPVPAVPVEAGDIGAATEEAPTVEGPDIEADLAAEEAKRR